MQSFARQEIVWAAKEMFEASDRLKQAAKMATVEIERGLCLLRAEQLHSIAERLTAAAENGDRRIAVR